MGAEINIGGTLIGAGHPPFIVAEFSGNHNQSLERALEMVEAAAASGVHAIKLQTYTADTLTIDSEGGAFFINDSKTPWRGMSLYELYQRAYTPWEWHAPIMNKCKELGLIAFSTAFDEKAVEFLEELGVPAYKIASFENNHISLIKKAASTGKPLIISTGLSTVSEIDEAVRTARRAGCNQIVLLKCTSSYPASPLDTNLATIPHLKELFECEAGLSDHTLGIGVSVASVALGAVLIEKHFTLSRNSGGVDSVFSLEPYEMKLLTAEAYKAWQALGSIRYEPTDDEKASLRFRRSIYAVNDIEKGQMLSIDNIRVIRPGDGLEPRYYELLLGRKAAVPIKKGMPLKWEHLK